METNEKTKFYCFWQVLRAWCQFTVFVTHFPAIFYNENNFARVPNQVLIYAGYWLARGAMSTCLIISGINAARWFVDGRTKTIKLNKRHIFKFYLDKIFNHAILYFLVFLMYLIYLKFMASNKIKDQRAEAICQDNFMINFFFLSNLIDPNQMVKSKELFGLLKIL